LTALFRQLAADTLPAPSVSALLTPAV